MVRPPETISAEWAELETLSLDSSVSSVNAPTSLGVPATAIGVDHTLDQARARVALGPLGEAWPVASLCGALCAVGAGSGAWLMARIVGAPLPWTLLQWAAEHALWGTLLGFGLALLLRVGARWDHVLHVPGRRRLAALRLAAACSALALVASSGLMLRHDDHAWRAAAPVLSGALAGIALAAAGLWLGLTDGGRQAAAAARQPRGGAGLRALDALRTAALLAVISLPLADGIWRLPSGSALSAVPRSLWQAWRVMLGA